MKSLRELYRTGKGPSSSHTIAPNRAAMRVRAVTCAHIALLSDVNHRIGFDDAVAVLLETGRDMHIDYRETAAGGLAGRYRKRISEIMEKAK